MTAYLLITSGGMQIFDGGVLQIGTNAQPINSGNTVTVQFNSAGPAAYGLDIHNGGSLIVRGNPMTAWTMLTSNTGSNTSGLNIVDSTGWAANDYLSIASTSLNWSGAEIGSIDALVSGSLLRLTGNVLNMHEGDVSTLVQAEIGNLTRNVKFKGIGTTSGTGFIRTENNPFINLDYAELTNLGSGNFKGALNLVNTIGTSILSGTTIYNILNANTPAVVLGTSASSASNISLKDCIIFNVSGNCVLGSNFSAGSNIELSGCLIMRALTSQAVLIDNGTLNLFNSSINSTNGAGLVYANAPTVGLGSNINNIFHSNSGVGIQIGNTSSGGIYNATVYRNNNSGINRPGFTHQKGILISGGIIFGNNFAGIDTTALNGFDILDGIIIHGGSEITQPIGIRNISTTEYRIIRNCILGSPGSHTTADWSEAALFGATSFNHGCFFNTLFFSPTETQIPFGPTNLITDPYGSIKHDQTNGNHKAFSGFGTLSTDSTIFRNGSPSERLTPVSLTSKLPSGRKFVAVNSGATVNVGVYVRQSVASDGTGYNGNRANLWVRSNAGIGQNENLILQTASVASSGTFQLLSGTTVGATDDGVFEFYVDSDGTTGWLNVDDWFVV